MPGIFLDDLQGIPNLRNLKCLDLHGCELSSLQWPEIIKLSKTLRGLNLEGKKLTNLPIELVHMEQLTYLNLYGNPLSNSTRMNIQNMFINNTKVKISYEPNTYWENVCG
ncbi:unnamed protein product [Adineta steineri]|uniref:Uncharacterized protein n=1 Tax=Adineta steineri TaxID=433720 RepID=A0A814URS1_9BILA|nr:unnamed protein product [Adineta steineri]CAF1416380.1 unnamed protein product [Adineta steineri]